mgnify:FL=1
MLENDDDFENINPIDNSDSELDFSESFKDADEQPEIIMNSDADDMGPSDVNMDDIFADIPPMPEEETPHDEDDYHVPAGDETVTVQPVKFPSFDDAQSASGNASKNLDNLLDIKLQLTVELGRTTLPVKKVLELTRGSIIELEKIAGEPVELYANGKLIAHGEVVVIEDNFGLRITSMTEPENRLNGLQ